MDFAVAVMGIATLRLASGGSRDVAEQPELQQALENAPVLETESLGTPARGVNVWERWMVPNRDGQSWDVLPAYFKEYYGPTWPYAIELGTGQVKPQRLPDGHQFYPSGRALGFDGKYYIATPSRKTWNMGLFVYPQPNNSPLDGVDPQWLIRWNGLPGTVAFGTLEGQLVEHAERILWAREPKTTVMALVPAASGGGRILFSQLDPQRRVDRASSSYDPAAGRVLLQLPGWISLKRQ
jgi:hypothetical protein